MTPTEAIKVLEQATANQPMVRGQHFIVLEALQTLANLVAKDAANNQPPKS